MYPTRLNVMSKQKQGHIKRMLLMGFVQNTIAVLFIVLAIFSIFALFSQVFLQSYFADVALQSIRTQNPTRKINERVQSINTTIQTASAIQKNYHHWSPLVVLLTNILPPSVTVDSVQFQYTKARLNIAGTAPSREALLELKTSLESLEQIDTVTIPLNDLTKLDHIDFTLSIPFAF